MALAPHDAELRLAAFGFLANAVQREGEALSWSTLNGTFRFRGELIKLVAPSRGIHKPRQLDDAPLTIVTAPPKPGRDAPYEDIIRPDGTLHYAYQGNDPERYDNQYLRVALRRRLPLIYLYGIRKGIYLPVWPVFVVEDRYDERVFGIGGEPLAGAQAPSADRVSELVRRYGTHTASTRLHQAAFRERVLRAYAQRCTICRLRHVELLDAAHIIPDREDHGIASVTNGLALCRLHHAAFDRFLIGIRPDHTVEVRSDILSERDGPMLEHGLKQIHDQPLVLPRRSIDRPDQGLLVERYETFRQNI